MSGTPRWGAVGALSLGVFGLVTAEFLPASLLTPMAESLGVSLSGMVKGLGGVVKGLFGR